jgi:hypothetical protein
MVFRQGINEEYKPRSFLIPVIPSFIHTRISLRVYIIEYIF